MAPAHLDSTLGGLNASLWLTAETTQLAGKSDWQAQPILHFSHLDSILVMAANESGQGTRAALAAAALAATVEGGSCPFVVGGGVVGVGGGGFPPLPLPLVVVGGGVVGVGGGGFPPLPLVVVGGGVEVGGAVLQAWHASQQLNSVQAKGTTLAM